MKSQKIWSQHPRQEMLEILSDIQDWGGGGGVHAKWMNGFEKKRNRKKELTAVRGAKMN